MFTDVGSLICKKLIDGLFILIFGCRSNLNLWYLWWKEYKKRLTYKRIEYIEFSYNKIKCKKQMISKHLE